MRYRVVGRAAPRPNCDAPFILEGESQLAWTKRCGATSSDLCKPCAETYRRRVRVIAESGRMMFPGNKVLMLTLTAPSERGRHCRRHPNCDASGPEDCDPCPCTAEGVNLAEWNSTCSARWNRFIEALRRELGIKVQYFRAAEIQDRGALHFHVLLRLPRSRGATFSKRRLRDLAMRHGFGHEVDLGEVVNDSAAGYAAKYVSKSCIERDDMPWLDRKTGQLTTGYRRYRCWTSSRHWGMTMATVRAAQVAWWAQRADPQPAQPAEGGALDDNGRRYAGPSPAPTGGGSR